MTLCDYLSTHGRPRKLDHCVLSTLPPTHSSLRVRLFRDASIARDRTRKKIETFEKFKDLDNFRNFEHIQHYPQMIWDFENG